MKKLIGNAKHKFVVILSILCLLLNMITCNVYAESFVIPLVTSGSTYSNGVLVYRANSIDYYYGLSASSGYGFYYISGSTKHMVFVAESNQPIYRATKNGTFSQSGSIYLTDSTTGLHYVDNEITANNIYLPLADSFRSGIDSIYQDMLGPVIKFPFTLQNGYLFVYDCGQSNTTYSFDLSSKSEEYSDIGSIPFPDTNQSYWFSDSLPEIDETTIPYSDASIISWQKGDKTNIFGQTQDMIANISGTSTGRYLYIYNPPVHYKWSGSSNPTASETINYPMIINGVSENENWYIYDSIARLTDFNQGGSVTGTVTGENITGSVSSDGAISLVTSSGAIYTQNSGGSTDISGANGGSLAENINGLNETLDNFVNQFIQLLSAPISHIQQLIQSSHQFFDVFSQLFEWLPSELSSVIVSGLIIMVVIGVIKMLL